MVVRDGEIGQRGSLGEDFAEGDDVVGGEGGVGEVEFAEGFEVREEKAEEGEGVGLYGEEERVVGEVEPAEFGDLGEGGKERGERGGREVAVGEIEGADVGVFFDGCGEDVDMVL